MRVFKISGTEEKNLSQLKELSKLTGELAHEIKIRSLLLR